MTDRKKKIKDFAILLKKYILKKDYVKFFRTFKDREENIAGYILAESKGFLLIQLEEEFLLNGYAIIKKDQFDSVRCNDFEKTRKKILKKEGVFERDYGIDKSIDLSNWQALFKDLKKSDYHVIVECEDLDEPLFLIGPIKRITSNNVSIQYYDPTGQLEEGSTSVRYQDITIVKFGDRYSKTFRKYLKPEKR